MASLQNYYLRGPVVNGDNVFIATQVTSGNFTDLYFLYLNTQTNVYEFYIPRASLPAVFTLQSGSKVTDPVTFLQLNNFLSAGTINNPSGSGTINTLVASTTTSSLATQIVGVTNPWGVFLTGEFYTFVDNIEILAYTPRGRQGNQCLPAASGSNTVTVNQFYVIPSKWFLKSAQCGQLANQNEAYVNEILWYYSTRCGANATARSLVPLFNSLGLSLETTFQKEGFARLSDCQAGLFYNYCTNQTLCSGTGVTACAGPCSQGSRDTSCALNSEQTFSCTVDSGNQNWWWIILIVVIVIIAIVLFFGAILLFFLFRSKSKPAK